jgi:hypothetical protein
MSCHHRNCRTPGHLYDVGGDRKACAHHVNLYLGTGWQGLKLSNESYLTQRKQLGESAGPRAAARAYALACFADNGADGIPDALLADLFADPLATAAGDDADGEPPVREVAPLVCLLD